MKGKILIILGVLIVLGSFLAYFSLEAAVTRERDLDPVGVLAARTDIPEGTVVKTLEQAQGLFQIIEVNRENVVPTAIKTHSETAEISQMDFISEVISYLFPVERRIVVSEIEDVVNKRITRSYKENEQILTAYLSDEFLDLDKETRLFAIPVDFIDSVAAEIFPNTYVDLWIRYDEPDEGAQSNVRIKETVEKIQGPYRVIYIKTDEGVHLTREAPGVPDAVVLRMTEREIKNAVDLMNHGTLFFTKHEK